MTTPTTAACTKCRQRKLKCDGQQPCSRCSNEPQACLYVKSRRGGKRKHYDNDPLNGGLNAISLAANTVVKQERDIREVLLEAYYDRIHPSHPFLPSYAYFVESLKQSSCPEVILPFLSMGSKLLGPEKHAAGHDFARMADAAIILRSADPAPSLAYIQLLLGQSLYKFAHNERELSINLLQQACTTFMSFDFTADDSDYEYQESLRKTVQELWMCDIMFAALSAKSRGFLESTFTQTEVAASFGMVRAYCTLLTIVHRLGLNGHLSASFKHGSLVGSLQSAESNHYKDQWWESCK